MSISRKRFLQLGGIASVAPALGSLKKPTWKRDLIKPKRLFKGCTLGLVAPGSPIYSDSDFEDMITNLKGLGYKLKLGKHVKDRNGYLAGTDKNRADDLMNMFRDDDVDGILCIRGGWGCNRILPLIDFSVIQSNPKALIGFSDITSLHMAIQNRLGLITFHGPVGKSDWNDFTVDSWDRVLLKGEKPGFAVPEGEDDDFVINAGEASGKLLGGNLTVLTSMMGSEYVPDFNGAILFLEDVGEDVYRIDRMLTQLKLNGILDQINGFVFGKCTDCSAGSNSLSLKEVFADHLSKYDIPAFYGAMISHEDKNITLPIGIEATIRTADRSIQLNESAVI
jgi:muramoyltetrapeptide carboxypeptidase